MHKELSVENVENFAEEALSETIKLNDDIMAEYMNNPEIHVGQMTDREHEDKAYEIFELDNINKILESINEVKTEIEFLKIRIRENTKSTGEIMVPPQPEYPTRIQEKQGGEMEEKRAFPRVLTLFYILKHDFNIDPTSQNTPKEEGIVTREMRRKIPYERVEIPELNRVVYLCEEEGNISYIFDTEKLGEHGITLETIDTDDKEKINQLITDYPGIGIRIKQSSHWRSRVASILGEPIPEIQAESEEEQNEKAAISQIDTPAVAKGEFDPWRGFWTDEEGMHWGTRSSIVKKLGRTFMVFKNREKDPELKALHLLDLSGKLQQGFCFEKFMELFPELQQENRVETDGEWRGFWIDPETGKHWASTGMLKRKTGVNDAITIKKYAQRGNLGTINVQSLVGRNTEAYCYEDLLEVDEFVDFLTAPQVNEEGEWSGFWADDVNQHWAPLGVLASYFKTESATMNLFARKINLAGKGVKTRAKEVKTAFCLESFKADKEFMEFINLPRVATEGDWSGFWTDENNRHWGSVLQISKKLLISRPAVDKHSEGLQSTNIKDGGGKPHKNFCLEEIAEKLSS